MNEKCCEDNFKKNQNYEISDSVDSHHLPWSNLVYFMQFESVQIQRFTNFLFLITAATQHIQTRVDWDYNVDEWKEMQDDGNEDK